MARLLRPLFFALIATSSFSISVFAEEKQNNHQVLMVTGSPIQKSIEGSSDPLGEFDNEAIIDAGDLLTRIAGFSAIRAGGHAIDPVLRGQSQTRINLLHQGAFLHGAGPNRMDSPGSYTEPFGWDELQIIKGVETLVYGSGGPAGILNFKRYRPQLNANSIGGKVMAAYSGDYFKLGADLSTGNEDGYFRLISQHLDQDNYKDGGGDITRTAFVTTSNTLVAGYTPSQQTEFRLTLMANRGEDALFAGTMMDGPQTDMDAMQLMWLDGDQSSNDYSEYQFYWNKAHHIMDNYSLRTQTAPMRMLTNARSKTKGAKWLKRWKSDAVIWQMAADWQRVERQAGRFMGMMGTPEMIQSRI
jgi:iron complex outermembrane receptor protein